MQGLCICWACAAPLPLLKALTQLHLRTHICISRYPPSPHLMMGLVPLNLHLGLMSSVGLSRFPHASHWSPRASCSGMMTWVVSKDGRNGAGHQEGLLEERLLRSGTHP